MEKKSIDKLFELIYAIIKRPAMYQVSKVEDLYLVIFGYTCAIKGDESVYIQSFREEFRDFVNEHFAEDFTAKKDHDWVRLIRFYSAGDIHSIELFGQLFEQFTISFIKKYKLASG